MALDRFVEGGRKALADRRRVNGRDSLTDENRRLKELVGHQALVIEAQKNWTEHWDEDETQSGRENDSGKAISKGDTFLQTEFELG